VRFLVDNQLPPSLARFISQDLQAEALHVTEIGMRDSADAAVWSYAAENNFVVISKDDDFVTLYSQTPSASLLWVRLGNCRRAFLRGRQLSSPNSRLRSETAFLDILVLNSRRRGGVNSLYNRVLRDDEDRSLLKPWMKLAHCNRPENRVQEIFNFL